MNARHQPSHARRDRLVAAFRVMQWTCQGVLMSCSVVTDLFGARGFLDQI